MHVEGETAPTELLVRDMYETLFTNKIINCRIALAKTAFCYVSDAPLSVDESVIRLEHFKSTLFCLLDILTMVDTEGTERLVL